MDVSDGGAGVEAGESGSRPELLIQSLGFELHPVFHRFSVKEILEIPAQPCGRDEGKPPGGIRGHNHVPHWAGCAAA